MRELMVRDAIREALDEELRAHSLQEILTDP